MNRFLPAIVVMFSFELAGWSSILAGTTTVSNIHNWRERVIRCQDSTVTPTTIMLQCHQVSRFYGDTDYYSVAVSLGVKILW